MAIKQILTVVGGVLGSAILIAGPAAAQGYGHGTTVATVATTSSTSRRTSATSTSPPPKSTGS